MKKSTLIICLLAAAGLSRAQSPAWVNISAPADYGNYDDIEVAVGVDSLGNVYTAASSEDTTVSSNGDQAMLVKYNSAGVQQWKKFFNPTNAGNKDVYVRALLVDKAGNSYVCGYGYHNGVSTKDYMLLKYDNAGNQIWAQYWDGGANDYDYITCATFDAAGNIVVGGYVTSSSAGNDLGVVKWDPSGAIQWSYTYNNAAVNGEDRALSITSDIHNNIFVAGSSFGSVSRDMITIKLNSAGINQWTNRIPHGNTGDDDRGYSVAVDTAGNAYATGAVSDWITVKYDKNGVLKWTYSYTDDDLSRYGHKKILVDKHDRVVIGGEAFSSSTSQGSNLVLVQLDNLTGTFQSSEEFDYGGSDLFYDMVMDTSGNVYMAGNYEGTQGKVMSSTIVTPLGTTVWTDSFNNSTRVDGDVPYSIAVDKLHNFVMAGLTESRGSGSQDAVDVITVKYAALALGIKDRSLDAASLKLYPNPSEGAVTISISDPSLIGTSISVTNLTGQTFLKEKITSLSQMISLDQLAKGIYLVGISNQNTTVTKKLIIK